MSVKPRAMMVGYLAAACLAMAAGQASADVIADAMGDTTYDPLYASQDGPANHLANFLATRTPPITGPGGSLLNVGDVTLGQNPATSAQTQIQRWLVTDSDTPFSLDYIGGVAGYKSIFGVYTYAMGVDPFTTTIDMTPLIIQQSDPAGTTASFTVPQDHYFGFYLNANGAKSSNGVYFSENFRNSDNSPTGGLVNDHFLLLESASGLVLAFEDLAYDAGTGLMGDQDHNDFVAGGLHVVPEPATVGLLAVGCLAVFSRRRGPRRVS